MQIIVTFGFFTLDDDMMSCVVQSDISEGNFVFFFHWKNILNIVFACQHFPLLFTGLHNHICKNFTIEIMIIEKFRHIPTM